MSDGTPSTPNEDAPLEAWRQGDFASDAGGFLFAKPPSGDYPYDAKELTEGIVGLVIISQTCDIVRRTGGRHYVAVCPLRSRTTLIGPSSPSASGSGSGMTNRRRRLAKCIDRSCKSAFTPTRIGRRRNVSLPWSRYCSPSPNEKPRARISAKNSIQP